MTFINTDELVLGLSIDCVIFGFHEYELKVLLMKMKNSDLWALPGGFVRKDRNVDDEAAVVLELRTGVRDIFLRQFHFFGNVSRNVDGHPEQLVKKEIISPENQAWFEERFVSVGYYALVEHSKVQEPQPDHTSELCAWVSLNDLPELMLDHSIILKKAHHTLRLELNNQPIGLNLLPETFTMPELQALYETVLGKELDRRNFRRKMLSYDILIDTNEKRTGTSHKAPTLYKFDKDKYFTAMQDGFSTAW